MSSTQYKPTGNNIPLTYQEIRVCIFDKLKAYDLIVGKDAQHSGTDYNPYTDTIIYTTPDGRSVQIPKDVQVAAVEEYLTMNGPSNFGGVNSVNSVDNEETKQFEPPINLQNDDSDTPTKVVATKKSHTTTFVVIALVIILVIFLIKTKRLKL